MLLSPWLLTCIAASVIAFYASARGLQKGEAVPVITLTSAAANVTAISGGILVFGDPMPNYTLGIVIQSFAFVLVIVAAALTPAPLRADARHRLAAPLTRRAQIVSAHVAGLSRASCGVAGLFAVARPAAAAFPGANGRIVFVSDRVAPGPNGRDIWTTASDGSDPQQLTSNTVADFQPAYSPDGTRIAFVRTGDIWVMNPDGGGQVAITGAEGSDSEPAWSPDGTQIVYVSNQGVPAVARPVRSSSSGARRRWPRGR